MNNIAKNIESDVREFEFTDDDFEKIINLVFQKTAISIAPHKKSMVYSRIAKRVRALKLNSFREYFNFLEGEKGGSEVTDFINAMTTNLTHFFRENHHFEHLKEVGLASALAANKVNKRVRIWSAGCSSGMEPYSIAMTIYATIPDVKSWDIKILATDIDTNMLKFGMNGVYNDRDTDESIPKEYLRKYTIKRADGKVEMIKELKDLIHFKHLNFIDPWPVKGPFDIIFCRNVVIYFQKDTQRVLFNKFAEVSAKNAWLYIGHSENLAGICDRYQLQGKTIYRKIK